MQPAILPLIRALVDADVAFVVVGGVAVVLRGHPRMTIDLDVVVDLGDDGNVRRAVEVLVEQGLVPRLPVPAESFADAEQRRAWVAQRNLTAFTMHDPADPRREVDLFAEEPVPFAELSARADAVEVDGVPVPTASVEDLVAMKRAAGRPQDLADVEALEQLEERADG